MVNLWILVAGAVALPVVLVMLALGFGKGIEWSQRHPKAVPILFLILGLLYGLVPYLLPAPVSTKTRLTWLIPGVGYIIAAFVMYRQASRNRSSTEEHTS